MTSQMTLVRVAVILLFAISFTVIGWIAPVLYATYMPSDMVIEEHSFSAQDVQPDAEQHYICFDRTVNRPASGQVFTELYLVSDGDPDSRTEIESRSMERFFQQGRTQVVTPLDLPGDLQEGKYRYLLVVKLDLADGRVERAFTFESQPFIISEDVVPASSDRPIVC
jgi:hypothetical protein